MLDLVGRAAAFRLQNREGYGSMMQDAQATTADGYLQVENDSAIVFGGGICWNTTVGCDCYSVLIGSRRMCRG